MIEQAPALVLQMANSEADVELAQNLRYEVFIEELGGGGAMVDHTTRREVDRFDAYFDHLLLRDPAREARGQNPVIGVYRLLRQDRVAAVGQFYSEEEYDLGPLKTSGRTLLELGRSCVHADYRGGKAMYLLWTGLADYVERHGIDVMFGVASFHGTDVAPFAEALSFLHQRHLAPPELRVRSLQYQPMDLVPEARIDRVAAMRSTPALIKAYLRAGGCVGDGAFIDRSFNTIDVCVVMDTDSMKPGQRARYGKARR